MIDILKKELKMEFSEAIAHVEQICEQNGFGVLLTKSLDDVFKKKLGIKDYPKYTIILVCNPKFAKAALDVSEDNGLLFPCSFVVFEKERKIYVAHTSIMKISPQIGLASESDMKPVIEMTGNGVQKIWKAL